MCVYWGDKVFFNLRLKEIREVDTHFKSRTSFEAKTLHAIVYLQNVDSMAFNKNWLFFSNDKLDSSPVSHIPAFRHVPSSNSSRNRSHSFG